MTDNKPSVMTLDILVVDDDSDILTAARLLLRSHFRAVDTLANPAQLPEKLAQGNYAIVLLDMNFTSGSNSGEEGFYWLQQMRQLQPDTVVVMMTAFGDVDTAVRAIKQGATDFVLKPWHNDKVLATLAAAEKLFHSRRQIQELKSANQGSVQGTDGSDMLGDSAAMKKVFAIIRRAAPTEANILITGENGTGKEMVAQDIHRYSQRAEEVFVSIDLGSLPESLFESELFGHKKGAFTGADRDRIGRMQAANGGTLFLDEIGNLPLHLQSKLLTALEQRQVIPVGGNQPVPVDIRLLSATNMPQTQMSDESRFRQDLLFRINTVELHLPPLRERLGDVAVLADHFLTLFRRKYHKPELELSDGALEQLQGNNWRGNVRELRHAIERAVILCERPVLEAADFKVSPVADQEPALQLDNCNLEDVERQAIEQALKQHMGNVSHAAKALGITRGALYRRMEKHGL